MGGKVGRAEEKYIDSDMEVKQIKKNSASLLQPKGCKKEAHDDTLTCKIEGGGGRKS